MDQLKIAGCACRNLTQDLNWLWYLLIIQNPHLCHPPWLAGHTQRHKQTNFFENWLWFPCLVLLHPPSSHPSALPWMIWIPPVPCRMPCWCAKPLLLRCGMEFLTQTSSPNGSEKLGSCLQPLQLPQLLWLLSALPWWLFWPPNQLWSEQLLPCELLGSVTALRQLLVSREPCRH